MQPLIRLAPRFYSSAASTTAKPGMLTGITKKWWFYPSLAGCAAFDVWFFVLREFVSTVWELEADSRSRAGKPAEETKVDA
jgi:hypothetical protein